MRKIYLLLVTALFFVGNSFGQITVSGSTGADGTYTSLTQAGGAFAVINAAGSQAGNTIVIAVTADVTTEDGTNQLNNNGWVTLTISPSGGAARILSGSVNGPLFSLNGATNVIIDGLKSGGNFLTLSNTNSGASASTVRFINDASNNTITNTSLLGSTGAATSTGLGVVYFSTGVTTGNDNNTISNSDITASVGGNPINAVYSFGTSAAIDNSGNTLSVINISDYFNAGAASAGININSGNSNWTITNNSLYQTATRTYTTASSHNGILITSGSGYTISNNIIGFANPASTGTTNMVGVNAGGFPGSGTFPSSYTSGGTANATRYNAINCAFTAGGTVSSIQNNKIGGIALYTSSSAATTFGVLCGIAVTSGNANIGTVTGNTIGSLTGASSIYAASTVAGAVVSGIYCTTTNTISIQNNTIGGIDVSGVSATTAAGFKGIDAAGTGSYTISNNNIGNGTANNIRTGYLLTSGNLSNTATTPTTATGTSAVQGILNSSTGATLNITGNTLGGIQISGSATTFTGINNTGAVTSALNINNNNLGTASVGLVTLAVTNTGTIACISNTAGGAACALSISTNNFQGVTYTGASTAAFQCINATATVLTETINGNNFNNLTVNTSSSTIGYLIGATNNTPTVTISNNYITTQFSNVTATGGANYIAVANNGGTATSGSSTISNNIFSNITFRTTTSFGAAIYWVSGGGAGCTHNISVTNNTISNINNVGVGTSTQAATVYGIDIGAGATNAISGNTISSLTAAGGSVIGIIPGSVSSNSTGSTAVFNNNVHDIVTNSVYSGSAAGNAVGIQIQSGPALNNVYKNKIYNITANNGTVTGMVIVSSVATNVTNVYNNEIGKLGAPNSLFIQAVRGINSASSVANTLNLYYNTVYLDGISPAGSYALYMQSISPTITLRNNILVNKMTSTNIYEQFVIFRAGTLTATYNTTSNNNILYCGTPGSSNPIYGDGTVSVVTNKQTTLAAFQTFVGPTRENASKTEDPPFLSTTAVSANFLHINPTVLTQAESGAVNIATYTDDYDGDVRQGNGGYIGSGTAPDIGSDEFDLLIDNAAPAIVYTAIPNDCNTGNRTLSNVEITDATGVPVAGIFVPRIYYKKGVGGTWFSQPGTLTSGTPQVGNWSFTIVASDMGGLSVGDQVYYYVIAQDITLAANISSTPSGVTASDVNTVTVHPSSPNSFQVSATLSGTYLVGVSGAYPTLTAAVNAYNTLCISGPVVFSLTDATYPSETYPITINSNINASSANTLTIKPAIGVSPAITGSNASAIIKLNGADYITIDGSNTAGGTSRDMTITNSSASGFAVIWLNSVNATNGATNNTIKNCKVKGNSSTTTVIGILSSGSTAGGVAETANSNNVYQNDEINTIQTGFAIVGPNGNETGSVISGNLLGSATTANKLGASGIEIYQQSGCQVTGNTIFGVTSNSSSITTSGISVFGTNSGSFITNNIIRDVKHTNSGGYGSNGIDLAAGNTGANITVANNFISDVASFGFTGRGSADNGYGIVVDNGGGYNIYYNTVNLNTNQSSSGYPSAFMVTSGVTAAASINLENNIFASSQSNTGQRYAISSDAGAAVFATIDYNDYYTLGANLGYVVSDRATLADIITGFGSNAGSVNVVPSFVSATDLHLTAANNCGLDGYGTPIAGITTDVDAQVRDAAAPDMGADEFNATYGTTLAAASYGTTVSVTKNVSASGTTYVAPNCDLIAKVLPAGASPVSGSVKVSVTRDPSSTNLFFNAGPYLTRHYDIEPATGATTATATITMYYTDQEFTDYNTNNPLWPAFPTVAGGGNADPNVANIQVTQYHGTPTTTPSSPGNYTLTPGIGVAVTPVTVNYNGTSWEVTVPVVGFSGFYVYTAYYNAALPITLNYLRGIKQGTAHNLSWSVTCNSTPTATLILERSGNGADFKMINSINATALRCQQPFDYADVTPLAGTNYYRLKMIDANGKISYSNIVTLINAAKGLEMMNIAPNPVTGSSFKLNISSAKAAPMQVVITDMQGRVVNRQAVTLVAGFNTFTMNVGGLAAGTYNIYGNTADDRTKVIRFVKQ